MNKAKRLQLLNEKVCNCTKCPDLVSSRTRTVFGEGNPNSRIVFCGEAPGRTEDELGRPFVGRAGELLNILLNNCGLNREDVYILNIVKCRPEYNRVPTPQESKNCRPFLDLQLKTISPKIIVCLGATAAQNLLGVKTAVNNLRGNWFDYNNSKVRVTFHPAYLLRNPSEKAKAWDDFQVIKGELDNVHSSDSISVNPSG